MTKSGSIRLAVVGVGRIAPFHLRNILENYPDTEIRVLCEPDESAYAAVEIEFKKRKRPLPPNEPDLGRLLAAWDRELDAALILTPHVFHFEQTKACLEAGLDVLLEKPMVMNADEARRLINIRDQTGRLLVVSFQGSLSPYVRKAAELLVSGEVGDLLSVSGTAWQNWREMTQGTWRQSPDISGGGFMFDTGAHLMNTVADLAGRPFVEVAAWLDRRGTPVDILAAAIGRLDSGALVTLHGCGDTIPSCWSSIYLFCTRAILRTDMWGVGLEIQRTGQSEWEPVAVDARGGVWGQFLAVREGTLQNPSPPEVGLRMARLWDAIRNSAVQGGHPVKVETGN